MINRPLYPKLCECTPPPFLKQKYKNVQGLLDELICRTEGGLPSFGTEQIIQAFPTIDAVFQATTEELEAAFNVAPAAARRYRILIQRLMLWANPDEVFSVLKDVFDHVIKEMPRHLRDIEEGGGGRDLLDPFIVAFASELLCGGIITELLKLLVAHKC